MTGICGWTGTTGFLSDIEAMASGLIRAQKCRVETLTSSGAAVALASRCKSALLWQDDLFILAIEGRPRLGTKDLLSGPPGEFAERFICAYTREGVRALENMHGQFAIALSRKDGSEALLATDRTGSQPLKYTLANRSLVFGSTANAINISLPKLREIDPQSLYNYIYFSMIPAPGTAFRNISRLLPGRCLIFRGEKVEEYTYWKPDYLHAEPRSYTDLKTELFDTLYSSLASSVNGGKTGAFLSGGIDSSTVAGMLTKLLGSPAHTYSIGFDAPGYDEMEYARIAARHFGTEHHEYYVTARDVIEAAPRVAAAYDAPFGNASAIPAFYCAKLATDDGIDQLLGGDGGDELFGGNSRYAKQWLFSLYEYIPPLVHKGLVAPVLRSSLGGIFPPMRKLQSYVHQATQPMPERMESYNLLSRLGPGRVFDEEFLAAVDPGRPLMMLSDAYHGAAADNLLERMLAVDMRFTLADNDLPKVRGMCDLAAVDVSFPLLDDRLLTFSQRLPASMKVRHGRLRYFFKRAMKEFLPPETIAKSKHGFGLPFGVWLRDDPSLQALAWDSLASLKQRHIIRPAFIDELASEKLKEHAAYYGTMVWVLMMLELWLHSQRL